MNCSAARRAIGAEPEATSPELEEHLRACPACEEYRREMLVLNENIRRALQIEFGPAPAKAVAAAAPAKARGWRRFAPRLALAASVALAIFAGLLVWTAFPQQSLAADVVAHIAWEPEAWDGVTAMPDAEIREVLDKVGVQLDPVNGDVIYARTCLVGKRWVPHFVVRTQSGPVTVIVLPDDPIEEPERFSENGYTGILMPAKRGSIAVLTKGVPDPEPPAQEILRALRFESHKS
jgi:hypothetical protein